MGVKLGLSPQGINRDCGCLRIGEKGIFGHERDKVGGGNYIMKTL
jgi:hypothetical protein